MPRALIRRVALAACATTVVTATVSGTANASGTFRLLVFPNQSHSAVYGFIKSAARSIDLTMYELHDKAVVTDLVKRRKAGIKVRVILDRRRTSVNASAYKTLKAGGVGVTYSSSAFVYTHQKTITVDRARSLIMTGNLNSKDYAHYRDYAVFDTDTADVSAIERVFNADYAKTSVTPSDGHHLVWSPTDAQKRLLPLIKGARHSLDVEEWEFDDAALVDAIVAAAKRGVAVRVVGMNRSNYRGRFRSVVDAGGKVVTYNGKTGRYIHAKAIVVDYGTATAKVFEGSENFSDNSLNHNRELGLIVNASGVLRGIETAFRSDFAGGTRFGG
ncbi:phospholipase D-like domain-containing protein [Actinoallomurus sp. NPDC050550]|uniref:phospholipase D-like domain-containing protein n=1 Tax=Actinoallomurus sp. NPDC050550 TaxID=3154937 RepID=UPI0033FF9DB4